MPSRADAITRPAAIRAIVSPIRLEILEALAPNAHLTVAEIAARVGRRAGSLYYHVNALVRAGAIVEAERRLVGRRWESRYRLVRMPVALRVGARSPAALDAATHAVRAMLRLTAREFAAALRDGTLGRAPSGLAVGRRLKARLAPAELDRVQRHLDAVQRIFTAARRQDRSAKTGTLVAFTVVLVPLVAPASPRRSRSKSGGTTRRSDLSLAPRPTAHRRG